MAAESGDRRLLFALCALTAVAVLWFTLRQPVHFLMMLDVRTARRLIGMSLPPPAYHASPSHCARSPSASAADGRRRGSASHPLENACKYPLLEPNHPDMHAWNRQPRTVSCHKQQPDYSTFDYDTGVLYLHEDVHEWRVPTMCSWRRAAVEFMPSNEYNRLIMAGNWTHLAFNAAHCVDADVIAVRCYDKGWPRRYSHGYFDTGVTHEAAYYRIVPLRNVSAADESGDRVNVNILELDSVSLNQFRRHMTKSWRHMTDVLGFHLLEGYHKVADNSDPNGFPTLAGLRLYHQTDEMLNEVPRRPDGYVELNDVDWLWKYLPQNCASMWNDDLDHTEGVFGYSDGLRGFTSNVFTHFVWPWHKYNQMHILDDIVDRYCAKNKHYAPMMFSITERFVLQFTNSCHFSFSPFSETTHNRPELLSTLDDTMYALLHKWHNAGVFANSALVVMGDHGCRQDNADKAYIGAIESRRPLFAIRFSDAFERRHPALVRSFAHNRHRLTSNFDVHQTLFQLITGNYSVSNTHGRHGRSLLRPVPADRTCADASIPRQFCTCMEPVEDNDGQSDADDAQGCLAVLKQYTAQCAAKHQLRLNHTLRAANGTLRRYTVNKAVRLNMRNLYGDDGAYEHKAVPMEYNYVESQYALSIGGRPAATLLARFEKDMRASTGGYRLNYAPLVQWADSAVMANLTDKLFC